CHTFKIPVCLSVLTCLSLSAGVFLVLPEGGVSLELQPSSSEVLLDTNSNFTVVCSGWSQVTWRLPLRDFQEVGVDVDNQGSSSILRLLNATWRNSGRYTSLPVPSGAEEWFVPLGPGVVMKEAEEDTIPCVVSDPRLNVSLFQRPGRTPVSGTIYEPGFGFTGRLNDTSYVCLAVHGDEEKESQVYHVFSIIGLTVSSVVLKQGEDLTVNCTVRDTELVFFTWDFPRREEIEPLTEFLQNRIRSVVNISTATVEDSGRFLELQHCTSCSPSIISESVERSFLQLSATRD
uniref:Immunoglobulin-like beta-sandwich domain-containing protein n=1 Tax=Labrus bergylta TaxID=56723 RepID=A0A3Q3MSA6_9LABR